MEFPSKVFSIYFIKSVTFLVYFALFAFRAEMDLTKYFPHFGNNAIHSIP